MHLTLINSLLAAQLGLAVLAAPVHAANGPNVTYLALGDSVPFGMNPLILPPYATQIPTPDKFVGYPEVVAAAESKTEVNASCPGETSASFLNPAELDLGCNSPHLQPPAAPIPAFKTSIGLHTPYTISQMLFAESQLQTNKHINLVTLSIGANDLLLALPALEPALQQCGNDAACAQAVLGPTLQIYAGHLGEILTRIRAQYHGTLILVKYYSPTPALNGLTAALNGVMDLVVAALPKQANISPVLFADGFTAFQLASALYNHDPCQAGLLIRLPPASPSTPPACDIHPSQMGRNLLAATVELAQFLNH